MSADAVILVFALLVGTAFLFYNMGLSRGKRQAPGRMIHCVTQEIIDMCAREFYPNDPDGRLKVGERLAKRSFEDLKEMMFGDKKDA